MSNSASVLPDKGESKIADSPAIGQGVLAGLVLTAAVASVALGLGRIGWIQSHGFSALTLAIVLGILVGNSIYSRLDSVAATGVNFSKITLLRAGVVLYGLRLTVQDIQHVGMSGIVIDTLVLGSTFCLACLIGTKFLGIDRRTTILIGAGSAICGAAAVMAASRTIGAKSEDVTIAIATVMVFGTLATFLYPVLYELNNVWHFLPGGPTRFGLYIGSTVHEVAQVIAAARSIHPSAADAAVIAKMVRVMMLAPFLILLALWLSNFADENIAGDSGQGSGHRGQMRLAIPWFAVGFVGVVLFNSFHLLPARATDILNLFDTALLSMAMAGLGLTTHLGSIYKAGARPQLLAAIIFAWLMIGGAFINRCFA